MTYEKRISRGEVAKIESGQTYSGIHFDDCDIDAVAPLTDVKIIGCRFDGAAATWFRHFMAGDILMTVDIKERSVTPGPASDRDPSFPGSLRRN